MARYLLNAPDDLLLRGMEVAEGEGISFAELLRRLLNQRLGGELLTTAGALGGSGSAAAREVTGTTKESGPAGPDVAPGPPSPPVFVPISSKAKQKLCGFRDHLAPVNKCSFASGHSGPCSWQT